MASSSRKRPARSQATPLAELATPPPRRRFAPAVRRWLKRLAIAALVVFVVLPVLWFAVFRFVPVPVTSFMIRGTVAGWLDDAPYRLRHDWVPLEEISPRLQRAVIASEDQKFPEHYGLDFEAMSKALDHNKRGRKVRGASTISQQTVKNIFLWPGRSYVRKGLEAWLTVLMETLWSKERILEVYLNSAEFGRGVYGAEAAAQQYFRKPASKLSAREAALLAAVLPAPRKRNPAKPSAYVSAHAGWIQSQMDQLGPVERKLSGD
ncbi:MAG: monofunctional biosynthetic peptidoglycan transglycosylase [Gammaproteobacteria bacterium]